MEALIKIIGAIVLATIMFAIVGVILALPTMWLWNEVIPDMFGLKQITLWQALCLNLLCACLFKSSSSNSSKKE